MNNEVDVENYISFERLKGASDEFIWSQLEQAGWKREQVEKHFNSSGTHGSKKLVTVKSALISLLVCSLLVMLFVFFYNAIKPVIIQRADNRNSIHTPTLDTTIFPSPATREAGWVDSNQVKKFIGEIMESKSLEFTDQSETLIGDTCRGKGEVQGIIQENNRYIKSDGQFTAETFQTCPIDLKEAFFETYWIGEQIYYRQYKDRNFSEKKTGESVAVGDEPAEYLRQILPTIGTIQLVESGEPPNTVKMTAINGLGVSSNYTIYFDELATIKSIEYQTEIVSDPEFGSYSSSGTLSFLPQQQQIVPPLVQ